MWIKDSFALQHTGLCDVDHVRGQRKAVELEGRDVCLEQGVDFSVGLVDALFDGDGHALHEGLQLQLLFLAHTHKLEFAGAGEDAQQLNLRQGGLEQVVVHADGAKVAVVVAGDAAKVRHLEATCLAIVLDQVVLVKLQRSRVNQVHPEPFQFLQIANGRL